VSNTCEGKKHRYLKVELVVLCMVVLWAADLRTHWVPRATKGALKQVIRVAGEHDVPKAEPEKASNRPSMPISDPMRGKEPTALKTRGNVTAEQLLQRDFELKKEISQTEFEQQWDIVNRKFGPPTNNPQIEAARHRELSELHQRYGVIANRVIAEYKLKMKKFADIDELAKSGMLNADPEEAKMRLYLPQETERALVPEKKKD
jgi:hypothetical protein